VDDEAMKKKPEPKNASFLIVMYLVSGIQRINALNFGTYIMDVKVRAKISVFSLLVIGHKWICGNI